MTDSPRIPWRECAIEAMLLGAFMISAALFGVLLFHPQSSATHVIASELARRCLMGAAMGLTAIALIYSPPGQRSGAHMNPAVTLTFWRLGKLGTSHACGYVFAHFVGAIVGMAIAWIVLRGTLAHQHVDFVQTLPGDPGLLGLGFAWLGEFVITCLMMWAVLFASNHQRLAPWTGVVAGGLVMTWIVVEAPISGTSMNPARTLGSALVGGLPHEALRSLWIYFTAPPLGMLLGSWLHIHTGTAQRVLCAKLHHPHQGECVFRCRFHELTITEHHACGGNEPPRVAAASNQCQTLYFG